LSLQILNSVPDDFWWEVARNCNCATFYHTPIWRDLALRTEPENLYDATCGAILPSGVRLVFPLVGTRQVGPLHWLHSTFEGCYGGFIADGPVSQREAIQFYEKLCSWPTYALSFLETPMAQPLPEELHDKYELVVQDAAYVLKLGADFDETFAGFQRTQRKDYRRGLKRGVKVRSTTAIEDYRAYYEIYRDAVARWGHDQSYGYDWPFFEQLFSLSQIYPEQIKLWVMTVDTQVVGGTIMFYWGTQASAWNGTAHRDFLNYDVMPVGDTEIIRDAITRGYRYFDFNTSSLNPGVITYKQRFGADAIPIRLWRFKQPMLKPMQLLFKKIYDLRQKASSDIMRMIS
jgi:lipid II:glycine glycyltransferase (peptidoglycan interpeptide bridge formation enzyme)